MMHATPAQLADVMIERARRDLEARDRATAEVHRAVLAVLVPERARGTYERGWLIGSLITGGFTEDSDVDVVVEGLSRAGESALRRALEDAARRPVDLLRFEELDSGFRAAVTQTGEAVP